MGKIKDIQIILENDKKLIYKPGEVISGIVVLNVVKQVKIRGNIFLIF